MTDTPEQIKALQLKLWLDKPPMERLRQMMLDNEALIKFWSNTNIKTTEAAKTASATNRLNMHRKKI